MKRIFAYLLSLLIVFNACGYVALYFWFDAKQEIIYHDAGHDAFAVVEVGIDDLGSGKVFQHEGHEWMINGQLYDVSSVTFIGSRVIFNCYHDTREELAGSLLRASMNANFGGDPANHGASKNNAPAKDVKFFESPHFSFSPAPVNIFPFAFILCKYIYPPQNMESPPPRISSLS